MAKLPRNGALQTLLLGVIAALLTAIITMGGLMWASLDARFDRAQQRQDRIIGQQQQFQTAITGWYAELLQRMARIEGIIE